MTSLRPLLLTAILVISTTLSACARGNRIKGSGPVETQTRSLSGITAIELRNSTRVHIVQGNSQEVAVKAYANLLPYLETRVEGKTLIITYKDHTNVWNDNSEVFLALPALESISVSGSGNMDVSGAFESRNFSVDVSGSSTIKLQSGSADNYAVEISGSGSVNGYGFKTKNAKVDISGSGNVQLYASESLKANISGSGNVRYGGAPSKVKSSVSGSGNVTAQ